MAEYHEKRVLQVSGGAFVKEGEKNWNMNQQYDQEGLWLRLAQIEMMMMNQQ